MPIVYSFCLEQTTSQIGGLWNRAEMLRQQTIKWSNPLSIANKKFQTRASDSDRLPHCPPMPIDEVVAIIIIVRSGNVNICPAAAVSTLLILRFL